MKFVMPAAVALSLVTSVGVAHARHAKTTAPPAPAEQTFYATPTNSGAPQNLPGENLIPGMDLAMQTVNTVTQPILQPLLAPGGGPVAEAAPAPMPQHRMHRHHMRHSARM